MDARNNVREFRESKLLSKAEPARLAGIPPLTVDRVERGMPWQDWDSAKNPLGVGAVALGEGRVFGDS